MRVSRIRTCLVCAAIVASAAGAQPANTLGNCSSYVGTKHTPVTIQAASARFQAAKPKGEFETTEQYEARIADPGSTAAPAPMIISVEPERDHIVYDADRGEFHVGAKAFGDPRIHDLAGMLIPDSVGDGTAMTAIAGTLSVQDKLTGTKIVQNGFGATARMRILQRKSWSIFDRRSDVSLYEQERAIFVRVADDAEGTVITGKVPVDRARMTKQSLKLAWVAVPRAPYLVAGKVEKGEPEFGDDDVSETAYILIADIQCGLLIDATGVVLGAAETK